MNTSRYLTLLYVLVLSLVLYGGGKPSQGTPADKRLKSNKPKTATSPATPKPVPPMRPKGK